MNDLISREETEAALTQLYQELLAAAKAGYESPEFLGTVASGVSQSLDAIRALPAASQPEAKWTGMGGGIAPKLDPNCECACHRQPGVMHVAPCCQSQPEAGPVASQISTIEAIYSNMPDIPELPDAYQPRNIAAELRVYHAVRPTTAPVVPAEGLERAREDEAKAGWVLDMELLKELRSDAGDWGYSLDLEAVEAIALEVEKRLRAQQPAAPVSGVTVEPGIIERAVWSAMIWAASNNAGFDGVPEYTDRGNSFAEDEARRAAARILSTLEGK